MDQTNAGHIKDALRALEAAVVRLAAVVQELAPHHESFVQVPDVSKDTSIWADLTTAHHDIHAIQAATSVMRETQEV